MFPSTINVSLFIPALCTVWLFNLCHSDERKGYTIIVFIYIYLKMNRVCFHIFRTVLKYSVLHVP